MKQLSHGIDVVGLDQRLIALHIHHNRVIWQTQQAGSFCQAIGQFR
jgi:hypothetical protein